MIQLMLVGGGGHCLSCIAALESNSEIQIKGIIDGALDIGSRVGGYSVLGDDSSISKLLGTNHGLLITVGYIRTPDIRVRLFQALSKLNVEWPVAISGNASVARDVKIGRGSIVMQHAIINQSAAIGDNCIINNRSLVEHGARVGSHSHVSTGAIVNGDCMLGERVFVGSGAVLRHGIRLQDDVRVGAGAIVTRDLTEPGWYIGNPARLIGHDQK